MYVNEDTIVMAYLFTILNSLQGLFIFIFHCFMDKKVLLLIHYQTAIFFTLPKWERYYADDKINTAQMMISVFQRVSSILSFSHNVFKSLFLYSQWNWGLWSRVEATIVDKLSFKM